MMLLFVCVCENQVWEKRILRMFVCCLNFFSTSQWIHLRHINFILHFYHRHCQRLQPPRNHYRLYICHCRRRHRRRCCLHSKTPITFSAETNFHWHCVFRNFRITTIEPTVGTVNALAPIFIFISIVECCFHTSGHTHCDFFIQNAMSYTHTHTYNPTKLIRKSLWTHDFFLRCLSFRVSITNHNSVIPVIVQSTQRF